MDAASLDFWIFTSACEARVPVSWLLATNRDEVFNLPDLSCTELELVDSLDRLISAEELSVERVLWPGSSEQEGHEHRTRLTPSRAQIIEYLTEEARTGRFTVYYGLTARGSERWERAARPKWHEYVDYWIDPTAGEGGISAQDCSLAECWLDAWPYIEQGHEITSVTWQDLRPWQATYWKLLPSGYEVRIWMRDVPVSHEQIGRYEPAPKWVSDLSQRASRWYSWPD
jgi:hypothetical protein